METMTTQTDALGRAIKYLDAVEVAPGRYAYQWDDAPNEYRVTDAEALLEWASVGSKDLADMKRATPLPAWWTPERRLYCKFCAKATSFPGHYKSGTQHELVTVNYETGEEVPA